jgi:peptide/nickel transport system permease protein
MLRYTVSRFLQALLTLWVLSVFVFVMVRLTGNPLDLILDSSAGPEDRAAAASQLGLDKPLINQYGMFLKDALRGDFGKSIRARQPVMDLIKERLPNSVELAMISFVIATFMGLMIGVYAAVARGSTLDVVARIFAVLGQSMPSFWLGLLLMLVFGVWLRLLPVSGKEGWTSFILPAFTMGWYQIAAIMRLTRSSMLETLGTEYVKLARIKGVAEFWVIWKHALRNCLVPITTMLVILFVTMISGAVLVETVFAWPGVGRLIVDAVTWRDYPLVQGLVLFIGAVYAVANFGLDILYMVVNPKVRYQ